MCGLSTLRSLQAETGRDCDNYDTVTYCPGNPGFYPIQSRPPVLDTFQELLEQDLVSLAKQHKRQRITSPSVNNELLTTLSQIAI